MATGDDRYQPALTAANLQKQPRADLVPILAEVQEQLRKLFEVVAKLEGRLGTIALRDSVTIAGSLTVSGSLSSSSLGMSGTTQPAVSPVGSGVIYFDSTSNTFKVSMNGSAYVDL